MKKKIKDRKLCIFAFLVKKSKKIRRKEKKCSEFALFKNENNQIIEEVKDNFYKRIQVIQMEEKKNQIN